MLDFITEDQIRGFVETVDPATNNNYEWTEIGAAELFTDCFHDVLHYVEDGKHWMKYVEGKWSPCGETTVEEAVKMLAKALLTYARGLDSHLRDPFLKKFAERWQRPTFYTAVIRSARSNNYRNSWDYNKDTSLLNCKNGTFNLKTLEFTEHEPSDFLTKQVDAEYNPNAKFERFDRFILEIFDGDVDLIRYVQKVMGYSLSENNELECLFLLYGPTTRNGKSTLCDTIRRTLKDYAGNCQPSVFYRSSFHNPAGPSEHLANLEGIRFCTVPEPAKDTRIDEGLIKQVTGNDPITARKLYSSEKTFVVRATFYLMCNSLPLVDDDSLFDSNRLMVIPFNHHFDGEEKDPNLKNKFMNPYCRSAVLNWLIEGYKLYKLEGLNPPDSVLSATEQYRLRGGNNSSVGEFMRTVAIRDDNKTVTVTQLYDAYYNWCGDKNYYPVNRNAFTQTLRFLKYPVDRARPNSGVDKTTIVRGYTI